MTTFQTAQAIAEVAIGAYLANVDPEFWNFLNTVKYAQEQWEPFMRAVQTAHFGLAHSFVFQESWNSNGGTYHTYLTSPERKKIGLENYATGLARFPPNLRPGRVLDKQTAAMLVVESSDSKFESYRIADNWRFEFAKALVPQDRHEKLLRVLNFLAQYVANAVWDASTGRGSLYNDRARLMNFDETPASLRCFLAGDPGGILEDELPDPLFVAQLRARPENAGWSLMANFVCAWSSVIPAAMTEVWKNTHPPLLEWSRQSGLWSNKKSEQWITWANIPKIPDYVRSYSFLGNVSISSGENREKRAILLASLVTTRFPRIAIESEQQLSVFTEMEAAADEIWLDNGAKINVPMNVFDAHLPQHREWLKHTITGTLRVVLKKPVPKHDQKHSAAALMSLLAAACAGPVASKLYVERREQLWPKPSQAGGQLPNEDLHELEAGSIQPGDEYLIGENEDRRLVCIQEIFPAGLTTFRSLIAKAMIYGTRTWQTGDPKEMKSSGKFKGWWQQIVTLQNLKRAQITRLAVETGDSVTLKGVKGTVVYTQTQVASLAQWEKNDNLGGAPLADNQKERVAFPGPACVLEITRDVSTVVAQAPILTPVVFNAGVVGVSNSGRTGGGARVRIIRAKGIKEADFPLERAGGSSIGTPVPNSAGLLPSEMFCVPRNSLESALVTPWRATRAATLCGRRNVAEIGDTPTYNDLDLQPFDMFVLHKTSKEAQNQYGVVISDLSGPMPDRPRNVATPAQKTHVWELAEYWHDQHQPQENPAQRIRDLQKHLRLSSEEAASAGRLNTPEHGAKVAEIEGRIAHLREQPAVQRRRAPAHVDWAEENKKRPRNQGHDEPRQERLALGTCTALTGEIPAEYLVVQSPVLQDYIVRQVLVCVLLEDQNGKYVKITNSNNLSRTKRWRNSETLWSWRPHPAQLPAQTLFTRWLGPFNKILPYLEETLQHIWAKLEKEVVYTKKLGREINVAFSTLKHANKIVFKILCGILQIPMAFGAVNAGMFLACAVFPSLFGRVATAFLELVPGAQIGLLTEYAFAFYEWCVAWRVWTLCGISASDILRKVLVEIDISGAEAGGASFSWESRRRSAGGEQFANLVYSGLTGLGAAASLGGVALEASPATQAAVRIGATTAAVLPSQTGTAVAAAGAVAVAAHMGAAWSGTTLAAAQAAAEWVPGYYQAATAAASVAASSAAALADASVIGGDPAAASAAAAALSAAEATFDATMGAPAKALATATVLAAGTMAATKPSWRRAGAVAVPAALAQWYMTAGPADFALASDVVGGSVANPVSAGVFGATAAAAHPAVSAVAAGAGVAAAMLHEKYSRMPTILGAVGSAASIFAAAHVGQLSHVSLQNMSSAPVLAISMTNAGWTGTQSAFAAAFVAGMEMALPGAGPGVAALLGAGASMAAARSTNAKKKTPQTTMASSLAAAMTAGPTGGVFLFDLIQMVPSLQVAGLAFMMGRGVYAIAAGQVGQLQLLTAARRTVALSILKTLLEFQFGIDTWIHTLGVRLVYKQLCVAATNFSKDKMRKIIDAAVETEVLTVQQGNRLKSMDGPELQGVLNSIRMHLETLSPLIEKAKGFLSPVVQHSLSMEVHAAKTRPISFNFFTLCSDIYSVFVPQYKSQTPANDGPALGMLAGYWLPGLDDTEQTLICKSETTMCFGQPVSRIQPGQKPNFGPFSQDSELIDIVERNTGQTNSTSSIADRISLLKRLIIPEPPAPEAGESATLTDASEAAATDTLADASEAATTDTLADAGEPVGSSWWDYWPFSSASASSGKSKPSASTKKSDSTSDSQSSWWGGQSSNPNDVEELVDLISKINRCEIKPDDDYKGQISDHQALFDTGKKYCQVRRELLDLATDKEIPNRTVRTPATEAQQYSDDLNRAISQMLEARDCAEKTFHEMRGNRALSAVISLDSAVKNARSAVDAAKASHLKFLEKTARTLPPPLEKKPLDPLLVSVGEAAFDSLIWFGASHAGDFFANTAAVYPNKFTRGLAWLSKPQDQAQCGHCQRIFDIFSSMNVCSQHGTICNEPTCKHEKCVQWEVGNLLD